MISVRGKDQPLNNKMKLPIKIQVSFRIYNFKNILQ